MSELWGMFFGGFVIGLVAGIALLLQLLPPRKRNAGP